MKIERNQLASVGQLHIWSLSNALPEKEVFQSTRIFRDGITKLILAEETQSFHSTLDLYICRDESSCGMFMRFAKASSTSASHCIK
jgi:hypothetical protein